MNSTSLHLTFVLGLLLSALCVGDDVPKASEIRNILKTHCYRCHGENGSAEGGMNFILSRSRLHSAGFLADSAQSKSTLLARIVAGEMPADDLTEVSPAEIEKLQSWLKAGAPEFSDQAEPREFLGREHIPDSIVKDLLDLPARDRTYIRYFTLSHFYNANCPEDELQTYRNALVKLINGLSWGRKIVPLTAIDPQETIFRFDLRELQWSVSTWNRIAVISDYASRPVTQNQRKAAELTKCQIYAMRGDWFVAKASRPPLYHEILGIPNTVAELENRIGVDVTRNYAHETYVRAAFNGSGVSRNNRLIERHESAFGYYWKSFDFGGNSLNQNLFGNPFGPGEGDKFFKHDGGELIFSLPNGLQAYMLVDAAGMRIDKGPTAIVSDPNRPDRAVENGISCMGCHAQGLIRKNDQIRPHALQNKEAFSSTELASILPVYRDSNSLNAIYSQDIESYRAAVAKCGIPFTKTEPILALVKKYEEPLGLAELASEFEFTQEEMRLLLTDGGPVIARALGAALVPGGTVQRDQFDFYLFQQITNFFDDRKAFPGGPDMGAYVAGAMQSPPKLFLNDLIADTGMIFRLPYFAEIGFKELRERDIGLIIETLPEPPIDLQARWVSTDDAGKLKLVAGLIKQRLQSTKANLYLLIMLEPNGTPRWFIDFKDGIIDSRTQSTLLKIVRPHFSKGDYDTGVLELVKAVKALPVANKKPK